MHALKRHRPYCSAEIHFILYTPCFKERWSCTCRLCDFKYISCRYSLFSNNILIFVMLLCWHWSNVFKYIYSSTVMYFICHISHLFDVILLLQCIYLQLQILVMLQIQILHPAYLKYEALIQIKPNSSQYKVVLIISTSTNFVKITQYSYI